MALHRKVVDGSRPVLLGPLYARPGEARGAPRHALPESEMDPDGAYQFVRDELMLDGNARLNLATFVTTWMEPQAERLMAETFDKNMVDKDEYPRTAELEQRCVNMLSRLWSSPDEEQATGTSTTGSSEAAMLAGMALERRWRARRRAGSWRLSSTPTSCGTSACRGCSRSTPRGTSTGWSTRAWGGSSGATPTPCPRSWCST
jgi:glutamate/tyrosine decarboxylase-like PLP-dependent enzyme